MLKCRPQKVVIGKKQMIACGKSLKLNLNLDSFDKIQEKLNKNIVRKQKKIRL